MKNLGTVNYNVTLQGVIIEQGEDEGKAIEFEKHFALFRISPDADNFIVSYLSEPQLGNGFKAESEVMTKSEVERFVKNLCDKEFISEEVGSQFFMSL